MQFPWMMYRKGPGLSLPHGQSVSCIAARDELEFKDALAAGWFPSVPEALAEKLNAPALEKPMKSAVPDISPNRASRQERTGGTEAQKAEKVVDSGTRRAQ